MQGPCNILLCHLDRKILNEAINQYRSEVDNMCSFSYRSFEQHNATTVLSLLGKEGFESYLLDLKLRVNSSIKICDLEIDEQWSGILHRKKVDVIFSFSTLYTEQKIIFCEPHNLWTDFFIRVCFSRGSFTGKDLLEDILKANQIVNRDDFFRKVKIVITKLLLMQYLYIESNGDTENHTE